MQAIRTQLESLLILDHLKQKSLSELRRMQGMVQKQIEIAGETQNIHALEELQLRDNEIIEAIASKC